MKPLIVGICLTALCVPANLGAQDRLLSNVHLYETTYSDGATREGFVAVTDHTLRLSFPPDEPLSGLSSDTPSVAANDDIILNTNQQALTYITHSTQSFGVLDGDTMQAMQGERDEMMKALGIEPGSGQDEELMNAFGDAMKRVQDARQQAMAEARNNPDMSDEDRARLDSYMKQQLPRSQSNMFSVNVTKTGRTGQAEGISCEWYRLVAAGVREICAASWDDMPAGEQTRNMYHAWFTFMETFMKGMPFTHSILKEQQKIDGFPLITLLKDDEGAVMSEQRYRGTEKKTVSFTPPDGYTQETTFAGGRGNFSGPSTNAGAGMHVAPGAPLSSQPAGHRSQDSRPSKGGCQKIQGEIVCSGEAQTSPANPHQPLNLPPEASEALEMFKGIFGGEQ